MEAAAHGGPGGHSESPLGASGQTSKHICSALHSGFVVQMAMCTVPFQVLGAASTEQSPYLLSLPPEAFQAEEQGSEPTGLFSEPGTALPLL